MNKLTGVIMQVQSSSHMSIVEVDVGGDKLHALVLETPETSAYLRPGSRVEVLFKETEVALAKGLAGDISIRNNFPSRIIRLKSSPLLTEITLAYQNGTIGSIITTASVQRMRLQAGDEVHWLVKTNELMLKGL